MKLGKPVKVKPNKNCASCKLFITCEDNRRAFNFCCSKFKQRSDAINLDNILESNDISGIAAARGDGDGDDADSDTGVSGRAKKAPKRNKAAKKTQSGLRSKRVKQNNNDAKEEYQFVDPEEAKDVDWVESALKTIIAENSRGVSPDLKIDDRDLKEAPNFFAYCTDKYWVGWNTYPKQVEVSLNYFNDYCTNKRCTDLKYVKDIPLDTDYEYYTEILDRVTFLNFGKCPKCGGTRADGWNKGIYHPYTELVGVAGQRCVHGETLILTDQGLMHISELFDGCGYGWSDYDGVAATVHGEMKKVTRLFKTQKESCYKITLSNGAVLIGTGEHPIGTHLGMTMLADIAKHHHIPIYLNQDVWGEETQTADYIGWSAHEINVPLGIRTGTRATVEGYLCELFRLKGIVVTNNGYPYVTFNVQMQTHAQVIQCMLGNLGIASCIEMHTQDTQIVEKAVYSVKVTGKYLDKIAPILQLSKNIIKHIKAGQERFSDTVHFYDTPAPFLSQITAPPAYYAKVEAIERTPFECVTYDLHIPDGHLFYSNGFISHNSGKSFILSLMDSYVIHKYLKLQNPAKVFKIAANSTLHGVFIALTMKQARETLFDPLRGVISDREDSWWGKYHAMLDFYGKKYGKEFYKFKDLIINYNHRNLTHYPSVPNKGTLRGRALYIGNIDELGYMGTSSETKKVKHDADEIHKAMKNSFSTIIGPRFRMIEAGSYDPPPILLGNIGSPSSRFDKLCRLLRDAENSKDVYAFHRTTFEMNPTLKITDPQFVDMQRTNPVQFRRDFLAIPPGANNAFISDNNVIKYCIDKKMQNAVSIRQETSLSNTGSKQTVGRVKFRYRDNSNSRLLAVDAGYSGNSFAGCVMSFDMDAMPQVDALFEVIPIPDFPINHNHVYYKIIKPIIENLGIRFICADRWQSLRLLSDAEEDYSIGSEVYSVKYPDFIQLRNALVDREIALPKPEISLPDIMKLATEADYPMTFLNYPVAHFILQCLSVEDVLNKTVIKGENRTDDMFRAFVLAYTKLLDPEVQSEWMIEPTKRKVGGINFGIASYGALGRGDVGRVKGGLVVSNSAGSGFRRNGAGISAAVSSRKG